MGLTIVLRVGLAWMGHHVGPGLLGGRVVIPGTRLAWGQWRRMVEAPWGRMIESRLGSHGTGIRGARVLGGGW